MTLNIVLLCITALSLGIALYCENKNFRSKEKLDKLNREYERAVKELFETKERLASSHKNTQRIKGMLSIIGQRFIAVEHRDCIDVIRYDDKFPTVRVLIKSFPFKEGDETDREFAIFEADEFIEILKS